LKISLTSHDKETFPRAVQVSGGTMRKLTVVFFVALLFSPILISGCDTRKDEREALLKQITPLEADLTRLNEQRASALRAIETLNSETKQDSANLQQHTQRHTKLQDELSTYLLDHKLATVSILVAGGGAATFINDNIDEDTKSVLRVVGVLGVLYCVNNAEECADVTTHVMYFGSQIKSEEDNITSLTSTLAKKKATLQEHEKVYALLGQTIPKKAAERDALKQKHDSLVCSFCL
jgi:chromosome segregation ATPase